MHRRRITTPCAALTGLLFSAGTTEAAAQEVGRGSTGFDLMVGLTVRPMLHLRRGSDAMVIEERGDTLTMALDVEVAANQAWSLLALRADAAGPDAAGTDAVALQIRDATGAWQSVADGGRAITVMADHAPCNYTRIRLTVRLVGTRDLALLRTLTLDLSPAQR